MEPGQSTSMTKYLKYNYCTVIALFRDVKVMVAESSMPTGSASSEGSRSFSELTHHKVKSGHVSDCGLTGDIKQTISFFKNRLPPQKYDVLINE